MNTLNTNVTVEMTPSIGNTNNGHHISAWTTNEDLFKYVTNLSQGEFGWILIGIVNLHFKVKHNGAVFTNAKFTDGDISWVTRHVGSELANILLQDHL